MWESSFLVIEMFLVRIIVHKNGFTKYKIDVILNIVFTILLGHFYKNR